MDKHTCNDDTKLMRVIHDGITCAKCDCSFPTLWSFREHLLTTQNPCLKNWELHAMCNECKGQFNTWTTLGLHYDQPHPHHTPVPPWSVGQIIPSSKSEPRTTVDTPYYVHHLSHNGKYWTYKVADRIEYVYRPHQL